MAKRKTIKRERYFQLDNTFDRDAQLAGKWGSYFGNDNPITLELGCGKADFSMALALKYPGENFIGIDIKPDRMSPAAQTAQESGVENVAFLFLHLQNIEDHFAENEVDSIWITFPDPYPKRRHVKHRMINPPFLEQYQKVLKPEGLIHFKTDSRDLFLYSLEVFVKEQNIRFRELSFDLHNDASIPDDAKIQTDYERKFLKEGKQINYTSFSFEGAKKV